LLKLSLESSMAARDLFIEAIRMDPTFARAHAGLANYYVHAHNYFNVETDAHMKAVVAAKRAIELDPNLAEAHVALGYTLSAEERFDEAEREFQKALEANPGLFEAHYYRGRAFYVRGDMERAVESFQHATSLDPNDFQTWALLASIHAGAGRADLAELCARPAVERAMKHLEANPSNSRAAYLAAGCSLQIGEVDQALELTDRSIAATPDDPGVYYNAACLYAQINRIGEALDGLARAVELGFSQKNWIENDPDLASLRKHPRYHEILDRIS
jgi:tetratricopeptide (TPR) repeat protein